MFTVHGINKYETDNKIGMWPNKEQLRISRKEGYRDDDKLQQ